MKARLIEFKAELDDILLGDIEESVLKVLFKDWAEYIAKGGVRPSRPH